MRIGRRPRRSHSFARCPARLAYTGHVITESLRLYPAAWGWPAGRRNQNCGLSVTKGMGVAMAQWGGGIETRDGMSARRISPERWEMIYGNDAAVRFFSLVAGRAVHRECVCADGSNADSGDDRAEFRLRWCESHPVAPLASITLRPRYGVVSRGVAAGK